MILEIAILLPLNHKSVYNGITHYFQQDEDFHFNISYIKLFLKISIFIALKKVSGANDILQLSCVACPCNLLESNSQMPD